ncbi:phosphoglycerate kinase [Candidatus Saccharibacteria bacterium]|nr:phosphoglycerate kinase [Candidatus Saccharibacteria bacterium]
MRTRRLWTVWMKVGKMATYQFPKQTIADVPIRGRTVLVRVDYNVPLENGRITSDFRIRAELPTLEYLLKQGARKVFLIAHLGRPEGVARELSLRPTAVDLAKLLDEPVDFVEYVPGVLGKPEDVAAATSRVAVLENLRFSEAEETDSEDFARALVEATGADLFVQDGFANVHRKHASMDAITKLLPAVAGYLVEKEVADVMKAIHDPVRPLLTIIGGAKVEDKAPMVEKMLEVADEICLGGKFAQDYTPPESEKILMPVDARKDAEGRSLDIGDRSAVAIVEAIDRAETIIWNGTVGMAEEAEFARSSELIATALGQSGKTTIICGGDTTGFVLNYQEKYRDLKYTLISTGGGASLELILGEPLPGLDCLLDK